MTGFYRLSVSDGLSNSIVTSIYQDSQGFIWFGTKNGLNKFDGINIESYFRTLNDPTSLSNSVVNDIMEFQGKLWVATEYGLNYYDSSTHSFRFIGVDEEDDLHLNNVLLRDIELRNDNEMWIATENGINIFNGDSIWYMTQENQPLFRSSVIMKIHRDQNGNMWVADNLGSIYKWNGKEFQVFQLGTTVRDFADGPNNQLWAASNNGLFKIDLEHFTFDQMLPGNKEIMLNTNEIFSLHTSQTKLWIGTRKQGLSVYDFDKKTTETINSNDNPLNGITSNEIWDIYESRDGIIWLGTYRGGVNFNREKSEKFQQYKFIELTKKDITNSISSIFEDSNHNMWYGLDGGGLIKVDPTGKTKRFSRIENTIYDVPRTILSIAEDKSGNIWMGSFYGGVRYYNPALDKFFIFPDDDQFPELHQTAIWTIIKDSKDRIWLGSLGSGVFRYDPQTGEKEHFTMPDRLTNYDIVWFLYEDSQQNIWVGTHSGLKLLENTETEFVSYTHNPSDTSSLSENWIHVIHEDQRKQIWVGTHGGGLNLFDLKSKSFKYFKGKKELLTKVIYAMEEDKNGKIWVSTDGGIFSLNPVTGEVIQESPQQLQQLEFNISSHRKKKNGDILFGNMSGFVKIVAEEEIEKHQHSPTVITGFGASSFFTNEKDSRYDNAILDETPVQLPHQLNAVFIEFSILSYYLSQKNKFKYKLEGYDSAWSNATTRNWVNYTNLPAGDYTFKVQGSNSSGKWSKHIAKINFTIATPWWRSKAFRISALILSVLIVYGIIILRTRYLQVQRQKLRLLVNKKTAEIEAQNSKLRTTLDDLKSTQEQLIQSEKVSALSQVVFNLLHELNSPLGVIKSGSELSQEEILLEIKNLPKFLEELEDKEYQVFEEFIAYIFKNQKHYSAVDKKALTATLKKSLEEIDRNKAEILDCLVNMECFRIDEQVAALLTAKNHIKMLEMAESIFFKYKNLENIKSSATRSISILNSLKTYGSQNFESFTSSIDVIESIEEALVELESKLNQRIVIKKKYWNKPVIKGNPARIQQIWINLISNAIQAMEYQGELEIEVKQDDHYAIIGIIDNGPGIPVELHSKIFEPFYTTKPLGEGRGIGLDIVNRALDRHGGTIEVDSVPGRTSFVVKLEFDNQ